MIDNKTFHEFSDTKEIPEPDILIISGGRKCLNDFFLWQIGQTYIEFVEEGFPDFNCTNIKDIIIKYSEYQKAVRAKNK